MRVCVFLDKPCMPEGPLIVEALLKSSVVISWKAPKDDGGSMITNYIVEKREAKEGEQWYLVSSSLSGTTCRVLNLTENAGYYFRVSAQNQYGVSEPLEIPSVVIIKSPFGKFIYILFWCPLHRWLILSQINHSFYSTVSYLHKL